jgi:hypothetical protein
MQKHARTGGILTIICGVFSFFYILMGIFYFFMPQLMGSAMPSGTGNPAVFKAIFYVMGSVIGLFGLVAGILAIAGGIFALNRKRWGLALAGAISAAALFFPVGIIATVLVSLGRPEFNKPQASDSSATMGKDPASSASGAN